MTVGHELLVMQQVLPPCPPPTCGASQVPELLMHVKSMQKLWNGQKLASGQNTLLLQQQNEGDSEREGGRGGGREGGREGE